MGTRLGWASVGPPSPPCPPPPSPPPPPPILNQVREHESHCNGGRSVEHNGRMWRELNINSTKLEALRLANKSCSQRWRWSPYGLLAPHATQCRSIESRWSGRDVTKSPSGSVSNPCQVASVSVPDTHLSFLLHISKFSLANHFHHLMDKPSEIWKLSAAFSH